MIEANPPEIAIRQYSSGLAYHVREFVPGSEGEDLEHRIALLKAREYAAKIRCKPVGEIARGHAIDAQQVADLFLHDEHCTLDRLKLAVTYCRNLVQAAVIAEFLDLELCG